MEVNQTNLGFLEIVASNTSNECFESSTRKMGWESSLKKFQVSFTCSGILLLSKGFTESQINSSNEYREGRGEESIARLRPQELPEAK